MDVEGLAKEWDAIEEVRERLRAGKKLYDHPLDQKWAEPNRANCVANAAALKSVLTRLREDPKHTLPYLDPLSAEITAFYKKANAVSSFRRQSDLQDCGGNQETRRFREKKIQSDPSRVH